MDGFWVTGLVGASGWPDIVGGACFTDGGGVGACLVAAVGGVVVVAALMAGLGGGANFGAGAGFFGVNEITLRMAETRIS